MKTIVSVLLFIAGVQQLFGGETVLVLSASMFDARQQILLAPMEGWLFRPGHDPSWANDDVDLAGWQRLKPTELTPAMADADGRVEGWFRVRVKLDSTLAGLNVGVSRALWAATDVYVDGELAASFGNTGKPYEAYNPHLKYATPVRLDSGREYTLAIHFVDYETMFTNRHLRLKPENLSRLIALTGPHYDLFMTHELKRTYIYNTLWISVSLLLMILFWLLVYLNPDQTLFRLVAVLASIVLFNSLVYNFNSFVELSYPAEKLRDILFGIAGPVLTVYTLVIVEWSLKRKVSLLTKAILVLLPLASVVAHLYDISWPFGTVNSTMLASFAYLIFSFRKTLTWSRWALVAAMLLPVVGAVVFTSIHKYSYDLYLAYEKPLFTVIILGAPLMLLTYIAVRFKEILREAQDEANKVLRMTEEKKELLANQNIILEQQVEERTAELNRSLTELKATQAQLVQQEKLASLGQLTAGIAHEIKNPLNFVNNFSSVSVELVDEVMEEVKKSPVTGNGDIPQLLGDIKTNLTKIIEHGTRADGIVKSMLQHSRGGSGKREPTDLNMLVKEYVNLAFHGMRAGKNPINVDIALDLDSTVGMVPLIAEDFSRVVLNLCQNAFDAMREKLNAGGKSYLPKLSVRTRREANQVTVEIEDNGPGIPDAIKDKILHPFFTTKKGTQGTGLGLSITHDIVKAHGGEMRIENNDNGGAIFIVGLPG
ncbi:MAG: GHKL domain-containing protein [Bacteroidetes bacterium]|nr:GHKL domain-containing protein [Bacteroidota bacterium]MCW5895549.1 GHKL domain-containing protein [Bacteroidota bacterium]